MRGLGNLIRNALALGTLPFWLCFCVILGGASSAGVLANTVLQITGTGLIAFSLWRLTTRAGQGRWAFTRTQDGQAIYGLVAITLALIAWIIIQLIPLPSSVWQNLAGRGAVVAGDRLLGLVDVYRPFSMQPGSTLVSATWLIVPVATLFLTVAASPKVRKYAGFSIIAMAALSSLIGVIQFGQGSDGAAYFYAVTNSNTSVGFFANSNHLATLYLCALVLCPWLFFEGNGNARQKNLLSGLGLAAIAFLVLSIILNRSLAGYVLLLPALAFVVLRHPAGKFLASKWPYSRWALLSGLAAISLALAWIAFSYLSDWAVGFTDPNLRMKYFAQSWELARSTFPLGTGLGAFRWAYTGLEDTSNLDLVYVNHVHNDYIEFMVEAGLFAALTMLAFAIWMGERLWKMAAHNAHHLPLLLSSAVVIFVIAGHSLVDYPARTATIAAIGAFAIGCLASPAGSSPRVRKN